MNDLKQLRHQPLKLMSTRIGRNYKGGLLLEQWQGKPDARDGYRPEEWVASTTEAKDTLSLPGEGLSLLDQGGENGPSLRDIIASDPISFLGADHVNTFGQTTALLVKIIDSKSRLLLQTHPDKRQARNFFRSDFGKTEAWYIIGGRNTEEGPPYVLLGFKEGVTRKKWSSLFYQQDIQGMIDSLHHLPVRPGEIYYIEGGMPHALGAGCMILEVQEPTDYTFRVERKTPDGRALPDSFCHQGIGFENMLDCFHYQPYSKKELLDRFQLHPHILSSSADGIVTSLISPDQSAFFSMIKLDVFKEYRQSQTGFSIAVVLSGRGKLEWDDGAMEIRQSDALFLPADLRAFHWHNLSDKLEIVVCLPPKKSECIIL